MKNAVSFLALSVALGAAVPAGASQDLTAAIGALVEEGFRAQVANPAVLAALADQNDANKGLSEAEIDALDKTWRAEVAAGGGAMIDAALASAASATLKEMQAASRGLITEIFVMDVVGLNVAQSGLTSDYWQGDEAKWQKTYPVGPDAVFVDEVELDESTQTLQSQVSFTLVDPASGAPVGAVTIGVNVELLGL
ncbi:hypothetical protein [Rubrimonas cliftonensis]|uniref:Uncharacterized protein n=1 Tax=Rubrimonas cliftonensis TaxID=89524 RepID=A0A1H4DTA8_9RHOB|nr:hypothetical protein [Rubrimonas cliftonensis]SEA75738.1 hypothetical protein SAMN05444370_11119 [Rubrimonas cliftonensis]